MVSTVGSLDFWLQVARAGRDSTVSEEPIPPTTQWRTAREALVQLATTVVTVRRTHWAALLERTTQ